MARPRDGCLVCVCVYSVCVVLRLGRGLATDWSLVQGVLPSMKNNYRTDNGPALWMGWKSHWKIKCVPLRCVIKVHKRFSCSSCVLSVPHLLRFYIYLQISFVENCKYWSFLFRCWPFLPLSFCKRWSIFLGALFSIPHLCFPLCYSIKTRFMYFCNLLIFPDLYSW
jgi:hypothetical protein